MIRDSFTRLFLKDKWRFHPGDQPEGEFPDFWYKGYDDSGGDWRDVYVPHDWSVEQPFSREYSSGTGYLAGGTGWYRLHFRLTDEESRCRRIRVCFDGVYKNSRVWINSSYLGERPSGYSSFSYDISRYVKSGNNEDNVLCVKVTHTDIADSRWFTGSGITRKVYLLLENEVHPVENSVFFHADSFRDIRNEGRMAGSARAVVSQEVVNTSDRDVILQPRVIFEIHGTVKKNSGQDEADENNQPEQEFILKGDRISLGAGETVKLELSSELKDIQLWSDDHPRRYLMRVIYCLGSENDPDCREGSDTEQKVEYTAFESYVGFRNVSFDPDKGFIINGRSQKLKGVCVHHDGGNLGAAMRPEVWQRRLAVLKEAGCNAIRCSHNPHMPELYDLCDAMGFYMMDEAFDEWINPKNKWWQGHNVYPPKHQGSYSFFPEWHERDLADMVRRDRNHPSVILYSVGNEIDYPNDPYCHPSFNTMTGNNDANKPEKERMYDPDKPDMEELQLIARELAEIVRHEDPTREATVAAAFPELSSNIGFISPFNVVGYNYKEQFYDDDHGRFPEKAFLGSENGHSMNAWKAVVERDFIGGQFLWTGIDYLGEARGWPVHGSPAGLITTAGLPKPEYYRRKKIWAADTVDQTDALAEGDTVVECWRRSAEELLDPDTDAASGTDHLELIQWKAEDMISGRTFDEVSAETGYLYQYIVRLENSDGKTVRLADEEIVVTVEGAGELVCLDSGDLSDNTDCTSNVRRTYRGELVIYVRRTSPGEIFVTAVRQ